MKQLNETFENSEFVEIEGLKKESKLTWRDFILLLVAHAKESIKKGDLKFTEK